MIRGRRRNGSWGVKKKKKVEGNICQIVVIFIEKFSSLCASITRDETFVEEEIGKKGKSFETIW